MCGVTGVWSREAPDIDDEQLRCFTDSLAHRGPDGRGVWRDTEARLALGHRRLTIFDLSERGSQPMVSPDGRYALTYNGEIYNHIELRRELEARGRRFGGGSDTEVLLAAWAEWGADCLHRFNGMWAFALWDRRKKELHLSRDRFGVKPLHYLVQDGRIAFASEMKAFLKLAWFTPTFDDPIVARTLENSVTLEGGERSLFAGINRVPAGHTLLIRRTGEPHLHQWWNSLDHITPVTETAEEAQAHFRELFDDACRLRMRSDAPVATALSGGVDSSAIFGVLTAILRGGGGSGIRSEAIRPFVATFPGTVQDERAYAEQVLRHCNADGRFLDIDSAINPDLVQDALFSLEEIDGLHLGPWLLYKEMRSHGYVVSIDGHGGDELLGGYPWHVRSAADEELAFRADRDRYEDLRQIHSDMQSGEAFYEPLADYDTARNRREEKRKRESRLRSHQRLAKRISRVAIYGCGAAGRQSRMWCEEAGWSIDYFIDSGSELWGGSFEGYPVKSPATVVDEKVDLVVVASHPGRSAIFAKLDSLGLQQEVDYLYYEDIRLMFSAVPEEPDEATHPSWMQVAPARCDQRLSPSDQARLESYGSLNTNLYRDFHFTILPTILRNFDRLSMAHGVEVRAPFMDWRLVCYTMGMPGHWKIGGGYTKLILREVTGGLLPPAVLFRKKKLGFGTPFGAWLQGPLKSFILDAIISRSFMESSVWDGPRIRMNIEKLYATGKGASVIQYWRILQAHLLRDLFLRRQG